MWVFLALKKLKEQFDELFDSDCDVNCFRRIIQNNPDILFLLEMRDPDCHWKTIFHCSIELCDIGTL